MNRAAVQLRRGVPSNMGREFAHPARPDCIIVLPDDWLYEHEARRNEAIERAKELQLPDSWVGLSAAIALLDDWRDIPGLPANPERWELGKMPIEVGEWLKQTAHEDFFKAFEVPKNSSPPLPNG